MNCFNFKKSAIAVALFGCSAGIQAQEPAKLGEITVKGEAMKDSDRSFTVNVIEADQIKNQRWENPLAIIEEVPGVDSRPIQAGSVADPITMRGMTSGGHGGDVGFSLDGITMNEAEGHADGYADTSILIPLELQQVLIYKGPVSPLYGNFARGGVMAFNTRKGGEYADVHLASGSFDTKDTQAAFGTKVDKLQLNGAMQGYDSEGWRDNSRFTKMNSAFRAGYQIDNKSEVALSLREHGATFEGPGNITRAQYEDKEDRHKQAAAVAANKDGGEKSYNSRRMDYNYLVNPNLKLLTFVYQTKMEFTRFESSTPTPGTQIERTHNRDVLAYGASLNGENKLFNVNSHWVVGAEMYNEDTNELQWATTARSRDATQPTSGSRMPRDRDFTIDTLSIYGQMDLDLHKRFRPTLGFRYDNFDGALADHVVSSNSGDLHDFDQISPKLGFRSELAENWELRTSVANGFALPNGIAKYAPNLNVDKTEFWQYEIGISGAPSPQWYVDLAYFILNSKDEVQAVPSTIPTEYINAGNTERSGLEGEIRYFPAMLNNFELSAGFSFFDAVIAKNRITPSLEGNVPQRVPEYMTNISAKYEPESGLGGSLRWRSIGEYYTNNDNMAKYNGYDIVNATVFYIVRGENNISARWYLDINNLTDKVYSEGVSSTAGQTEPNSFNPRPPMNFMVGAIMSFK